MPKYREMSIRATAALFQRIRLQYTHTSVADLFLFSLHRFVLIRLVQLALWTLTFVQYRKKNIQLTLFVKAAISFGKKGRQKCSRAF